MISLSIEHAKERMLSSKRRQERRNAHKSKKRPRTLYQEVHFAFFHGLASGPRPANLPGMTGEQIDFQRHFVTNPCLRLAQPRSEESNRSANRDLIVSSQKQTAYHFRHLKEKEGGTRDAHSLFIHDVDSILLSGVYRARPPPPTR